MYMVVQRAEEGMAASVGVRAGAIRARREGGLAEGAACAIDWHGSVWRRAWERCGWGGEDGGRREQGGEQSWPC